MSNCDQCQSSDGYREADKLVSDTSQEENSSNPPHQLLEDENTLKILPQYLNPNRQRNLNLNYVNTQDKQSLIGKSIAKLSGKNKNRCTKLARKCREDRLILCSSVIASNLCAFGDACKFCHSVDEYLKQKEADISNECHLYRTYGYCPFDVTCRFAGDHMQKNFRTNDKSNPNFVCNALTEEVKNMLRKRKYNFGLADACCLHFSKVFEKKEHARSSGSCSCDDSNCALTTVNINENVTSPSVMADLEVDYQAEIHTVKDAIAGLYKMNVRSNNKKVDLRNKLYLAPLTTVGNLPFRRLCKNFGADVTCGEMILASSLIKGTVGEWALMKRHESEDIFGVQIAGGTPNLMASCTQLINENCAVDFIDINAACPLQNICAKGMGASLTSRKKRLCNIVCSMKAASNVPITIKLRTGLANTNDVHTIIPCLKDCGIDLISLHGRTKNQRYTKTADWDYINYCAKIADPVPFYGVGDIMSFNEYDEHMKDPLLAGCMIGRGALIKPWIFTEIKEKRHWDITASERLDMLKTFVNYGLEHWGCDTKGVETTRWFLLEWLSFLHRYVPVGILEVLPQKINKRPPSYFGRNDTETLLSSPSCSDWIKISEMFLGKVPEDFSFLPRHKANAYENVF